MPNRTSSLFPCLSSTNARTNVSLLLLCVAALSLSSVALAAPRIIKASDDDDTIALVVEMTEDNVSHREFARGVIDGLEKRWQWVRPGITAADASDCQGDDACLLELAKEKGAAYLVILGTAPLDDTQLIASLRALRISDGAEIFGRGEVVSLDENMRETGKTLMGEPLASAPGMPESRRPMTSLRGKGNVVEPSFTFPKTLSLIGFGLMGTAVVLGGALALVAAVSIATPGIESLPDAQATSAVATSLVVVGAGLGIGLVTVGEFVAFE